MASDKERDPGSSSAEIGKYLDILARDPKSRVFAPLAEAYRKAGLLDDAVATALEGLKIHPNYLGGRVALGRAYYEKKQYAEAAAEMEKVAKAAPDNIIAHRVLGQIADGLNDLPAAEKAFRMVLLLDPRDLEAREFIESLKGAAPSPPSAPAPPPPPAPAPLPFEEIQGIEDLDLQAEEIVGGPPPIPEPATLPPTPPASVAPPPLRSTPPPVPVAAPPLWSAPPSAPVSPAPLPQPPSPPAPSLSAPSPPPSVPISAAPQPLPPQPPQPIRPTTPPPPPALVAPPPLRSTPPPVPVAAPPLWSAPPDAPPPPPIPPTKTPPQSAPPPPVVTAEEPQPPFEQFSREPGPRAAPAPARVDRGGKTGAREMELETTAYPLPDTDMPAAFTYPAITPDEALPLIAPTQEIQIDSLAQEYPDEELTLSEPAQETHIVPPQETRSGTPAQEHEEIVEEEQEQQEQEQPAAAAGRGVFDTETLASIYIKQGFYGRAAEIYRRLLAQSPNDEGLRGKLKDVLALQRREAGDEEPVAHKTAEVEEPAAWAEEPVALADEPVAWAEQPVAAVGEPVAVVEEVALEEPATEFEEPVLEFVETVDSGVRRDDEKAPIRTGPEMTIDRLETLLEAFKGGRPQ